jgi:broad specificity phosphatase PhoE
MQTRPGIGRVFLLTAVLSVAAAPLSGGRAPAQSAAKKNVTCPQQVLIIRHAEKTGEKTDIHLSKAGKERAEILYRLFVAAPNRSDPLPAPDFIFAASHHKDSQRPFETVTPLSVRLKLPVNHTYENKAGRKPGMLELRDEIFGKPKYFGKTILVAWRHSTISELAKILKANNVPAKWEDPVFDRVWQITYDDQGKATFRDRPQRLLSGDAER